MCCSQHRLDPVHTPVEERDRSPIEAWQTNRVEGTDFKRCSVVAPPTEYHKVSTQCERIEGHEGPHFAQLGLSSNRIWEDVSFKMNFIKPDKQ